MEPRIDLCRLRRIAGATPVRDSLSGVSTGHAGIDAVLGGGLPRAQLHELFAGTLADAASAAALAGIWAHSLGGKLVWLREERAARRLPLHAHGLAALGLDPACLLLGILPDADSVLRAGTDVLRCPGAGVAVIELWGNPRHLDLTATRRFQLAAEASGVTALLLRIDAQPASSAAATRWIIRSVASRALAANAPGPPGFALELQRHRGGGRGGWQLEWDREAGKLVGPALSVAVVSVPADRSGADVLPLRRAV